MTSEYSTDSEWWALLGPFRSLIPTGIIATPHNQRRELEGEHRIGPLAPRPGLKRLTEWLRGEPMNIVQGRWPGAMLEGTDDPLLAGLNPAAANERVAAQ
jgi:hypothetical protein